MRSPAARQIAATAGVLLLPIAAVTQEPATPTFNRDVAPIFFSRCAGCHRPGEAAPMPLLTYRDARPWARAIRQQVANRSMPPWPADPAFSRPLVDDARLTSEQIATIVGWVDAGAPEGSGSPPPVPA